MKTYKINILSHLEHLWILLLLIIAAPVIISSILDYSYDVELPLILWLFLLIFFIIPHLLLHIHYVVENYGDELTIEKHRYTFLNKKIQFVFEKSDVKYIQTYKSKSLNRRQLHIFPWDFYHYSVIHLKTGERLVFSSLLVFEIESIIEIINSELQQTIYPWICKNPSRPHLQ